MGRFYKTAKPEFIDDFTYQPPWELMKEALGQEQQSYDASLAKADLFKNIDINYIDDPVERQKVKEKQDLYALRADELTKKLQSSGNDWKSVLPEINNLKREVESDYKTGDISKIEKSAANYKAMEDHLKTIKDPVRKEAARQAFLNEWKKNPNRSIDNTFQSNEIYDKQDPTGEFLAELKNSKADIYAKATATSNGRYIDTKSLSTEELKGLKEAYASFVKAKNYEPYFKQEQQFGLGKYFDEQGNLLSIDDPNGSMHQQGEYIKNFEYKQQKAEAKKDEDQYGLLAAQEASSMRLKQYEYTLAKANQPQELPITFNKDTSFYYNYTKEGKEVVQKYKANIANLATQIGAKDPKDYDKYMTAIRNNPSKYPAQFKELQRLDNMLNVNMTAGTQYFKNLGFNQKQIDYVDTKFKQKGVEKILSNKEGYLDFGSINGKQFYNEGLNKGEKVTLSSLKGKSIDAIPGYKGDKISNIEIVEGTAAFMPAADISSKSGTVATVKITPENGEPFYSEFYIGNDPLNVGF